MSHHQNWNDMSSSSQDQDSWFDDEEQQSPPPKDPEISQELPSKPMQTSAQEPKQTSPQQPQQLKQPQTKSAREEERTGNSQRPSQKRRAFPTDEELLNQYINRTVDDPKAIKVSKCHNEDVRQIVKNIKTAKVKEINESTFFLFFDTEEHLIDFLKEKMAKRYRFFFSMFEKRTPKEGDPRYRNRDDNNRREHRPPRTEKDDRNREPPKEEQKPQKRDQDKRRKRYQGQDQSSYKEKREDRRKKEQEQKSKKVYHPKLHFQIGQNSNIITILSDSFEVANVIEEINRRKFTKNFSRIIIKAPFYTFPKVSIVCYEIAKLGYFLEKEPATTGEKQSMQELILVEKGKNKTDSFYERYNEKIEKKETKQLKKEAKEQKKEAKEQKKQANEIARFRLLGAQYEDYFKQIDKYNLNEIVKGFQENEFIKRLKEASQAIQKYWNSWKLVAADDNIEVLLKLTNRIKKSTIYDIELKPSLRNDKALLTAELRQRPEKDRRPKVDVSNVNNYLS